MFENIIGQTETVQALREELAEGRFPRSSLFFGPPYCGKLSTALEAARALTCREGKGDWTCECASCRLHRELAHPYTVLLGPRYSGVEIAACADALMRNRRQPTRFLFLRAVRKLTRRFDPALWDSDDARLRSAQEKAGRIDELLLDLPSGSDLPPEPQLGELLELIVAACAQLAILVRGDGISIGQIRRLSAWAHMTATASRKIAILENADRMQESARNALLKLLEEPPAEVHLIVLSTRRAAIIPTVLSRLRPYVFAPRSPAEEAEVLSKIFRAEPGRFPTLRSFFLAWKEINPEMLSALAGRFWEGVGEDDAGSEILGEIEDMLSGSKSQKETATSFLEELTSRFREQLGKQTMAIDTLEEWSRAIRESHLRLDLYNINPLNVVEALFYRMRLSAPRGRAMAFRGSE
jgi:DNA polymerase III delta prime subunit